LESFEGLLERRKRRHSFKKLDCPVREKGELKLDCPVREKEELKLDCPVREKEELKLSCPAPFPLDCPVREKGELKLDCPVREKEELKLSWSCLWGRGRVQESVSALMLGPAMYMMKSIRFPFGLSLYSKEWSIFFWLQWSMADNFFGLKQVAKTHLITTGSRAAFWLISYYYSKVAKKQLFKATITEFLQKSGEFYN
jgi:hypothetical protein